MGFFEWIFWLSKDGFFREYVAGENPHQNVYLNGENISNRCFSFYSIRFPKFPFIGKAKMYVFDEQGSILVDKEKMEYVYEEEWRIVWWEWQQEPKYWRAWV